MPLANVFEGFHDAVTYAVFGTFLRPAQGLSSGGMGLSVWPG